MLTKKFISGILSVLDAGRVSSRKRRFIKMENVKYYVECTTSKTDESFSTLDEALSRLYAMLECESHYNYKINATNTYCISTYDNETDCWTMSRPVTVGEWRWLEYDEKQALINDIKRELF